ncbi:Lipid A export ATP-binding/permease protein MsbA [Planctomycetes bacterium Poly30]|uniref:Lipid A export ATP-binding/permease protein MsbA n=1 Tax=Saltatorellus ferox TaxID=2528018 RepID=A0A518EVS0_9BACT|nr:Lipid A export ATP-binding/permease protein MsbA [Planctomycetes bacterium Poly30]
MKLSANDHSSWNISRRFFGDLVPFRLALLLGIGLQLIGVGLELAQPWAMQQIFDRALIGRASNAAQIVYVGSACLAAAVLLRIVVNHVATLKIVATGHALTRALRLRVFRHLVELPPNFHTRQKSGDLLMRLMGDAPMVSTMLVEASSHLVTRAIQVVGTVALMVWVDLRLTLTLAIFLPIIFFVARFLAGKLRIATRKQRRKEGDMADYMQESLGAAALIQSLGREGDAVRAFAKTNRRNARAGLKTARAAARLSSSVEGLLAIALGITVLLGGLRVLQPAADFSAGELIVFISYVRGLMKPIRSAAKHQARVAKGTACGERLLRVLDEDRPVRLTSGKKVPVSAPVCLAYERVSYAYPGAERALRHVSFEVRAGDYVALFGASGAGKSTLAALALRLMDPDQGRVTLDGVELPEYDLDRLRERFALSMQSTMLFGASVAENLQLGDPEAEEPAMWRALEDAGAAEMVRELPGGLEYRLGASGSALSGGQRKRICLARAFLRKSPILIADEPFNGLDAHASARVEASLRQHAADGGMVIVVTHDAGSLHSFDRVLFLDGGRLIGAGTDRELRGTAIAYQHMVEVAEGSRA